MWTCKTASFAIILASYWILGGATVTIEGQLYSNIKTNDKIFMDNITFESTTVSIAKCAAQCNRQGSCMTFTFHQNICRGHGILMTSCSATLSAPGARSFAKIKVADRCEGTGVIRLRDTSLGLHTGVYCDDGWLVFQRRQDGCVDFYRNWYNYTNGFGDVNGEYWLGVNYDLRVDLMAFDGTRTSYFYTSFSVGPASEKYKLDYGSFLNGTKGDSLKRHRGQNFSTPDADNDVSSEHCAVTHKGGWWYRDCMMSNPNGIYKKSREYGRDSIVWKAFGGSYSLKSCQMLIRPAKN